MSSRRVDLSRRFPNFVGLIRLVVSRRVVLLSRQVAISLKFERGSLTKQKQNFINLKETLQLNSHGPAFSIG